MVFTPDPASPSVPERVTETAAQVDLVLGALAVPINPHLAIAARQHAPGELLNLVLVRQLRQRAT
jgi:hypothetical protein